MQVATDDSKNVLINASYENDKQNVTPHINVPVVRKEPSCAKEQKGTLYQAFEGNNERKVQNSARKFLDVPFQRSREDRSKKPLVSIIK